VVGPARGERCWRGRCRSCPPASSASNTDLRKGCSAVRGGYAACESSCTLSGLRAWAECARDAAHPLRSVTRCRSMQPGWRYSAGCVNRARRLCVFLTRAAVGRRCTHRLRLRSRAVIVSGTTLLASAGGNRYMGCVGVPLRLLWKRAALSPSRSADSAGWVEVARAQHGAAGSVSGVCDGWSPDVRTPLPAYLERFPALQTSPSPKRRCLALLLLLLPWWDNHLNRSLSRRQRCV
jgi:hypothetical protein